MFVHLHVHSAYSLLNGGAGASSLEALAEAALERGMSTLALTDVNGVYGAMDFRRVTEAYGLRPVYGASLETPTERAVLLPLDAAGWASWCRGADGRPHRRSRGVTGCRRSPRTPCGSPIRRTTRAIGCSRPSPATRRSRLCLLAPSRRGTPGCSRGPRCRECSPIASRR